MSRELVTCNKLNVPYHQHLNSFKRNYKSINTICGLRQEKHWNKKIF